MGSQESPGVLLQWPCLLPVSPAQCSGATGHLGWEHSPSTAQETWQSSVR